ncbi:MAG: hypothetical protein P4L46_05485 [Fimbriimonas sp.]|nr:hypothetical protein [Fimbriimonas sp.]
MDPDAVLAIVLKSKSLRDLAVSPNLGKPSLDNQRKIMSYFDDARPETRAAALDQFVRWYAEWDKRAFARWSDTAGGETIQGEGALKAYWIQKIGLPIKH